MILRVLLISLLIIILPVICAEKPAAELNLMPLPASVSTESGLLRLTGDFSAVTSGPDDPRLQAALNRFRTRIGHKTGLPVLPAVPSQKPFLAIEYRTITQDVAALGVNESYVLDVAPSGVRLSAPTATGAMRGLETLLQLVAVDSTSFYIPAVHIQDSPRFPWRGLMLDVSRHWMPVEVVKRNVDAMAAVKLNVLHWHLSDDQGFRVESKVYPKLHESGSDGNYYTQDQVREVIGYARDRGIRVVPEFDIPGHTTAWFVGYPELASAPGPYQIERHWGIFTPTIDPTREQVYTFLDALVAEMAGLFADDYFHVGGDEVLDRDWKNNAAIQAFAKGHGFKSGDDLQGYFTSRVDAIVTKHGKKMVGWDEVLRPGLSSSSVIQSWRGQKSLADAAQKGYRGLLSYGYYLDHMRPASFHYAIDPMDGVDSTLTPDQSARILGGEACMWSEYISPESIDSRLWPRSAAIAERLWSPRTVKNVDSMYDRMTAVSRDLEWTGVVHQANYQRMMERLAAENPCPPLQTLTDVVEALGIEGRRDTRRYSSLTPLNRLVDLAKPESESVRRLTAITNRFSGDPAHHQLERDQLREAFVEWRDNHQRLLPALNSNYLLQEVAPVSEDLSKVGAIGLQALEFIEAGKPAPPDWIRDRIAILDSMSHPNVEVVLAAARPVRILLEAARNTAKRSASEIGRRGSGQP